MPFFLIRKKSLVHSFMLDDIPIEIQQKPIKSFRIRISKKDGRVFVSAPIVMRLNLIQKQIEKNRDWIHTNRARWQAPLPSFKIEHGAQHAFLGEALTIHLHENHETSSIKISEQTLKIYTKPGVSIHEKEQLLKTWYRQQMLNYLPHLIEKWQPIIGVHIASFHIKSMTSRWGSCNPQMRRISLNLKLIKYPLVCLEYVLVHEMIHILEPSHNKRFYALMQQFLPHWREYDASLKRPLP